MQMQKQLQMQIGFIRFSTACALRRSSVILYPVKKRKASKRTWQKNPNRLRPKTNPHSNRRQPTPSGDAEYTSKDLEHLSDLEHVRERPSMYIGDTTVRGLHHLVYEVVDNSIDEAMAGHATTVSVTINVDGSVTVEDDGRGIPVERHAQLSEEAGRDVSTLEGVMTVLKFGGKFQKGAYQTSGGLHGVGVTVVNFLSEWCEVEVCRDGSVYHQEYERGVPASEVRRTGQTQQTRHQNHLQARSARSFQTTKFVYATLVQADPGAGLPQPGRADHHRRRPHQRARVVPVRRRHPPSTSSTSTAPASRSTPTSSTSKARATASAVEVALQYSTEYTENVHSYVNNINTTEGGTHLSGFRTALTRSINNYGKNAGIFKDLVPTGEDFREGLTAVISCRVPHPQFEGQTKTKLGNSEVEGIVNSVVGEYLAKYLEENPKAAKVHRAKGPAGRRGPRSRPQAERAHPRTQRRALRRRPARQAPRLLQPRRRQVRAVPGGR